MIYSSASDDNIWRAFSSQKVFILERKKPGVPLDFLAKNSYYLSVRYKIAFGRFGGFLAKSSYGIYPIIHF